jgi:2-haloacid dehalogenase
MTRQVRPVFNIDDVHRRVLDELVNEYGWSVLTEEDRVGIQRAWHALDAWSDFPAALARLRRRHAVVSFTILSTSLIIDVSRKNGIHWDAVVSCEMIGSYKPNQKPIRPVRSGWLPAGRDPDGSRSQFRSLGRAQGGYRSAFVRRLEEWGAARPTRPNAGFIARHRG